MELELKRLRRVLANTVREYYKKTGVLLTKNMFEQQKREGAQLPSVYTVVKSFNSWRDMLLMAGFSERQIKKHTQYAREHTNDWNYKRPKALIEIYQQENPRLIQQ